MECLRHMRKQFEAANAAGLFKHEARLVELVVDLINLCMPAPIKFYVHSVPCTDMGEGVAMGVAYFVYPGGGSHEEMAKQHQAESDGAAEYAAPIAAMEAAETSSGAGEASNVTPQASAVRVARGRWRASATSNSAPSSAASSPKLPR